MKPNVKQAERYAAPEGKTAPSLLGDLVYQTRTQEEYKEISSHAESMERISSNFRRQLRDSVRQYRIWRTSHEINDVRAFYLQVEGKMKRDHLKGMYRLYRESYRDLKAMHRELRVRFPPTNGAGADEIKENAHECSH